MKNNLKPYFKIKKRRSSFGRLNVVAYGYLIYWNRLDKHFAILHASILCCLKFKTLKDAVLTCKMNEGTHIQKGDYWTNVKRTKFTYVKSSI